MTEQEYDEQIAPLLAEIAKKVVDMGGSIVARVEWAPEEAGITYQGITDESGIAQKLAAHAALCRGNIDQLIITLSRKYDMSQTVIGRLFEGPGR